MSRSKGRVLIDQKKKIYIIGDILEWPKSVHWEDALDISAASYSNWIDGKPISEKNIASIATKIRSVCPTFSSSDLDLPLETFCQKLNYEIAQDEGSFEGIEPFTKRKLNEQDIQIMRGLARNSCILFLGRDGVDDQRVYVAVEPLEILPYSESNAACFARQRKNQITGTSPSGLLRSTNERVSMVLSYEDYNPESLYYAVPIFFRSSVLLYGFYVDVTPMPEKEVFAVKFILLPEFSNIRDFKRLDESSALFLDNKKSFEKLVDLLKDEKPLGRKRFVIPSERKLIEQVRDIAECFLGKEEKE